MTQNLNEGLDYHDMKNQVLPKVTVDEYAAKMGDDSNIVTLTFIVKSKLVGEDLVNWLELGYDYVLDASVSDGELEPGKWLVFVEMKRRSNVPEKIVQILTDLETLTDMKLDKWSIVIDDVSHTPDKETLKKYIILSPSEYKIQNNEEELNEMRQIAGLSTKNIYENLDDEIRKYITSAGL